MANQIDFAMAVAVMIAVIAFSISYTTNYFSRSDISGKSAELYGTADMLEKMLFGSEGIPANWENYNYNPVRAGLKGSAPRIPITASEKAGVNHSLEEADIHVAFDMACANKTYNNSIRIYDRFMNETSFRIYNYTECTANSGFLKEANINFLFNITGNTSQIFWLYYTNNTQTQKKSAYNFSYDTSLVGYWKLDSVNSTNYTLDSTQNKNDGQLKNFPCDPATCNLTAGQIFSGLGFDGVDDYVQTPSFVLYDSNYMTFEAWIYPKNLGSRSNILGQGNAPQLPHIEVGPALGGYKRVAVWNPDGWSAVTEDNVIDVNKWYHIAYARNASLPQKIYVNGVSQTLIIDVFISSPPVSSSKYIGQYGTGSNFFNGTIDEVRIYNRSLSADEIKAHYNFTRPNYIISSESVPVIAHKKMSALQNLSYNELKASLDLKKNFNVTACEYSFGRHVPETVNVMTSKYPLIMVNSSGSVKSCLATINVW